MFIRFCYFLALIFVACSSPKKQPEPKKAPVERSPSNEDGGKATVDLPKAHQLKELSKANLELIMVEWLRTQNEGDFEGYKKLYAKRFWGVKRAGPRVTHFKHETWINDRQRMFKKPMTVKIEDLTIKETTSKSRIPAEVNFIQEWSSGQFSDKGPKKISFVIEDNFVRIYSEKMSQSEIFLSKKKESPLFFLYKNMFVLRNILVPDFKGPVPKSVKWESGSDESYDVILPLSEKELSPELKMWKGRKIVVDETCETEVLDFGILHRWVPHFMTYQDWNCTFEEEDCVKATKAEITESVIQAGSRDIVAVLNDCEGIVGRLASETKMSIGKKIEDEALFNLATKAMEEQASQNTTSPFSEWAKEDVVVNMYQHPKSGRKVVSVQKHAASPCDSEGGMWEVWEVKGKKLNSIGSGNSPLPIDSAIDTNNDGRLEFIVRGNGTGIERALVDSSQLSRWLTLWYGYNDCPC